jgi:hypothetical protein
VIRDGSKKCEVNSLFLVVDAKRERRIKMNKIPPNKDRYV